MGEVTPHPAIAGGPSIGAPEPIVEKHDPTAFDCGQTALNAWLRRRSKENEGLSSRTYIISIANRIIGFYTLAAGAVIRRELPKKTARNTPEQVPIVVLGRLAIDKNFQKQGLGAALLKDAIVRTLLVSRQIGARALVVHAINDEAIGFYERFEFLRSPLNARTLVLPIETARAAFSEVIELSEKPTT